MLDVGERRLLRGTETVRLSPKAYDLGDDTRPTAYIETVVRSGYRSSMQSG